MGTVPEAIKYQIMLRQSNKYVHGSLLVDDIFTFFFKKTKREAFLRRLVTNVVAYILNIMKQHMNHGV